MFANRKLERRLRVLLFGLRKIGIICFLMLFVISSFSQVSAQETGTLIVYAEAQGGDATFSYGGSGSLASFQISTEGGGGAKVFDLTAGAYTLTQNSLPSGWGTKEVFCDGTGTYSTDVSQNKVTFTVASAADVFYLRYTNLKGSADPTASPAPSPTIPEFPAIIAVSFAIIVTSAMLVLFSKRKTRTGSAFAVLLSVLLVSACVFTVQANPEKLVQLGTKYNDEQIQFGTIDSDVIVQLGFGDDDSQSATGNTGNDWIIQNGGNGDDSQTVSAGVGNKNVIQEGGSGIDNIYAEGGSGFITFIQNGGLGDDNMTINSSGDNCSINVNGGDGDDIIEVTGSFGTDTIIIRGGIGNDKLFYNCLGGNDQVQIYGDSGNDFLTILKNKVSFQIVRGGQVIYSIGTGGETLTIDSIEHGKAIGDSWETLLEW
jgi:hypothetical protein